MRFERGAELTSSPPLQRYRRLEHLCQRMLDEAMKDARDTAGCIDDQVRNAIWELRCMAGRVPLSPDEHAEKLRILRRIVHLDAQLRHLESPWERDLDAMLAGRG